MEIDKTKLKMMKAKDIENYVLENGSVFVSNLNQDQILVQHIYIGDNTIMSLEYSPQEQFEQILPNIWYREYSLPNVHNLCYWLFKNCEKFQDEEKYESERDALYIEDKYSKNVLPFYDEQGNIYFNQTYIYPIKNASISFDLKNEKLKFHSNALQEEREIIIEYPKNYSNSKKYKILILTDGLCWKYTMHLGNCLANDKDIDEYIICYILQKNRNLELPMNKNFCKFITADLINYLTSKFNLTKDKNNFVFCGQSFGGLTALYIDMYFSNKIGTLICQSASLWYDKQDEIINHYKNNNVKSKMYYSYGNCEKPFITDKGILFKNILSNNKCNKFNIFAGGHDYVSWQKDILNALKNIKF